MSQSIYEIYINQANKTLIFCKESEYKNPILPNSIFTDMYIYEDDTLLEAITKIKISIIDNISTYNSTDLSDLSGYLSANYDYYDTFKLEEYISNTFDNKIYIEDFKEKLKNIGKNYSGEIIDNNYSIDNISLITQELVIGYYDNIYKPFYFTRNYMDTLINNNKYIEEELNNPINHYRNYVDRTEQIITNFSFTLVEKDSYFKNTNIVTLPKYLDNITNNTKFFKDIYLNDYENKSELNTTKSDKEFTSILFNNINKLTLEIYNNRKANIIDIYNKINLSINCPFSSLRESKNKTYKLYKENEVPYIKEDELEEILKQTKKNKFIEDDILQFKIYFIKNEKNTNYLIDVYIIEDNYFYINFDFLENRITNVLLEDIIININNICNILNLNIGNKRSLSDVNEFYYYNNRGIIKINNNNNFISSDIKLILNYNELDFTPKHTIHKFLHFLSLFHNYFDIYLLNLEVYYNDNKHTISYINESGIKLSNKKNLIDLEEGINMILLTSSMKLYYKKSKNYNSFNYLEKYIKNMVTYNIQNFRFFNCLFTDTSYQLFLNFLYFNGIKNDKIDDVLNNISFRDNKYCKHIIKKTNNIPHLDIEIANDIFYMKVINLNSFIELENVCSIFNKFVYCINEKSQLKYNNNNIYHIEENNYYNKFNNIFNNYNSLQEINKYEYFIYLFFKNNQENDSEKIDSDIEFSDDESDDNDSNDDFGDDSDDDSDDGIVTIKLDENIESYNDLLEYKKKYCTVDSKDLYKHFFKLRNPNSICKKERRPSILDKSLINEIIKKEEDNLILVDNESNKYFKNLFNFQENTRNINTTNTIDLENTHFYMGRNYILNITNNTTNKLLLVFNEDQDFILENFDDNKIIDTNYDKYSNVRLNIYLENKTKLSSINEYLQHSNDKYIFELHFKQNDENNTYPDKYSLGLYNTSNKLVNKINIILNEPENYYIDPYIYGDYYFLFLPSESVSTQGKLRHPRNENDYICCYEKKPHLYKDLSNNNNKTAINKKVTNNKDFKLDNYKIGLLPIDIYTKLCNFLSIKSNDNYFKEITNIQPYQPYRFGLSYNSNINKFLYCIINIIKLTNSIPDNVKSIFNLTFINPNNIKKSLIDCINNPIIINDKKLKKLNNNIFSKNTELKNLFNIIKEPTETEINDSIGSINNIRKIRDDIKTYIDKSFINLDFNFIWNLCSLIFNINIIIFDIKFTDVLKHSIRCQPMNNHNIYDFNNRKTCFILNFDNVYQPITIPTMITHDSFEYNILFNFNDASKINLKNIFFNKCLLRYDNESYNNVLINSVYHNIDFKNNIILDTNEINELLQYIKYIIINEDYIKLGIVFEVSEKKYLYIPINFLKHNINYNVLEQDYKFLYKQESDTEQFIHSFDDTLSLITTFHEIHKNNKLNYSGTLITKHEHIIGIGIYSGDYIPIKSVKLTDLEDIDDTIELADISYYKNIEISEDKKNLYNKFNYINLYYEQFLNSINDKLYENKQPIENVLDNKIKLKKILDASIRDLFPIHFSENMYLTDTKLKNNNEFKICNKLDTIECNDHINCLLDDDCKYIITEEYYNMFLELLTNDLFYNHYKRNSLLNNFKNNVINTSNETHIILEESNMDNNTINNLYNKIITDKLYYITGKNYKNNKSNISKNNPNDLKKICNNETKHNTLDFTYYNFKSLNKINIISYSNCIYYNLALYILEITENSSQDIRRQIAHKIRELIDNETFNLYDIINYYDKYNNTHLYNDINNSNDLFNILISDTHWITELDLYIFSDLHQKKIILYNDNGQFKTINEYEDIVKIYVKPFYYKNLYYLIK